MKYNIKYCFKSIPGSITNKVIEAESEEEALCLMEDEDPDIDVKAINICKEEE